MLAQTASHRAPFRGIRRLDISRDLGDIAGLIDEAFGDEPDHAGEVIASEFRRMSRWSPVLWLLDHLSPTFRELFTGFVWVEDGHVVGNANLSREGYLQGRWMISNVVVGKPYRRRGIARQLMEASLDFIRLKGGRLAYLLVRRDNEAAMGLYEGLGFSEIGGLVTLTREGSPASRLDKPPLQDDWRLRNTGLGDYEALNRLFSEATPESLLRSRPAQGDALTIEAEQAPSQWLRGLFGRRTSFRWMVEADGKAMAYVRLEAQGGKRYRMRIIVHPDARGKVEGALIARLLDRLHDRPKWPILADVGANETGALSALEAADFEESRWLVAMVRHLDVELKREEQ